MRISRVRLSDESALPLEVLHPDGTIRPAKYNSQGVTIATVQGLAQRHGASGEPLTWIVREAEDENHAEVARIVRRADGVIETYT